MMNGKYVMSKFLNVNDMQKAIMEDKELNGLERLLCIFNTMKTGIKDYNPYLYYCLLAIEDKYKIGSKNNLCESFKNNVKPHKYVIGKDAHSTGVEMELYSKEDILEFLNNID